MCLNFSVQWLVRPDVVLSFSADELDVTSMGDLWVSNSRRAKATATGNATSDELRA